MEKNYKIIFYSKQRSLYILCIAFFPFFFVFIPLIAKGMVSQGILIGGFIWMILGIIFYCFPIFLKRYAKAHYQVKIDAEGIQFDNIKPYLWKKLQQPLRINFDQLISYLYDINNDFYMFRLRLKTGKKIIFFRDFIDCEDDFEIFLTDFEKALKAYNNSKKTDNQINEEKLIIDNTVFLWVKVVVTILIVVVLTLILMASVILLILKKISNQERLVILIVFVPLILVMIWTIIPTVKRLRKN